MASIIEFPSRTETANIGGAHAAGCKSVLSGLKAACQTEAFQIDCGALNDRPMTLLETAGRELLGPARRIPHLGKVNAADKPTGS